MGLLLDQLVTQFQHVCDLLPQQQVRCTRATGGHAKAVDAQVQQLDVRALGQAGCTRMTLQQLLRQTLGVLTPHIDPGMDPRWIGWGPVHKRDRQVLRVLHLGVHHRHVVVGTWTPRGLQLGWTGRDGRRGGHAFHLRLLHATFLDLTRTGQDALLLPLLPPRTGQHEPQGFLAGALVLGVVRLLHQGMMGHRLWIPFPGHHQSTGHGVVPFLQVFHRPVLSRPTVTIRQDDETQVVRLAHVQQVIGLLTGPIRIVREQLLVLFVVVLDELHLLVVLGEGVLPVLVHRAQPAHGRGTGPGPVVELQSVLPRGVVERHPAPRGRCVRRPSVPRSLGFLSFRKALGVGVGGRRKGVLGAGVQQGEGFA
eukprot:scaffold113_cov339-Pavlova_lutheri.AAC.24